MTNFRFRLEKVLALRRTQLELEEAKFEQRTSELRELENEQARIEAAGNRAEREVRGWSTLTGYDLETLAHYRKYVTSQEKQIAGRRDEARQRLAAQQQAMFEAQRRCQLLERLRDRRRAEWQAQANKELEELAAESYLANLARNSD